MRQKQLIMAVMLMLVLAVVGWFTRDKNTKGEVKEGDFIFSGIDSTKMNKFVVNTPGKSKTEIYLKDGRWVVKNRYDMEADPALIRKVKTLLAKSRAVQVVNYKETDLNLFGLDSDAVTLSVFEEGRAEPHIFKFGKTHQFQQENEGRYIYLNDKKSVVLVPGQMYFISGLPHIWLKKFLPYHEQVAGVSLWYQGSLMWKTDRNNPKAGFQLIHPKNSNTNAEKTNALMVYAMQMRFMDIVPALNNFEPDKEYQQVNLDFHTFSGRTYKLTFLKKDGNMVRCRMDLIATSVQTKFVKQYGSIEEIRDEIREWHFMASHEYYKNLFNL